MEGKPLSLWGRVRSLPAVVKATLFQEGSWRGPFKGLGNLGHVFGFNSLEEGWQRDIRYSRGDAVRFGPVYACISVLAQEMSRVPIVHYKVLENKEKVEITNKAPYRVFRKPNRYQSKSDFILYLMWSLLTDGNAYAMATRNDRYEVDALYPIPPGRCWPYISGGEVFYRISDSTTLDLARIEDGDYWVPQRDMFHIRLHCPSHPLVGESPLVAAFTPAITGLDINAHTEAFFRNMGRPSGILRHPGALDTEAMVRIKNKFKELFTSGNTGEPIVLREGMDWTPLTMTAVDAELVKSFELTERQIAQVFRVPPFLLGDLEKATFQNVESLSRFFIQSALGWYVDHFESNLALFFEVPADEFIYFDVEAALLRGDLRERMEAYAKGVQNGVLSPNDARARENLPPVEHGEQPRVQQQLVPLSYGIQLQPPGLQQPATPTPEPQPEPTEEQSLAAALVARKAIEKAMQEL